MVTLYLPELFAKAVGEAKAKDRNRDRDRDRDKDKEREKEDKTNFSVSFAVKPKHAALGKAKILSVSSSFNDALQALRDCEKLGKCLIGGIDREACVPMSTKDYFADLFKNLDKSPSPRSLSQIGLETILTVEQAMRSNGTSRVLLYMIPDTEPLQEENDRFSAKGEDYALVFKGGFAFLELELKQSPCWFGLSSETITKVKCAQISRFSLFNKSLL